MHRNFSRFALVTAVSACLAAAAHATVFGDTTNNNQTYNQGGTGGQGGSASAIGQGGAGGAGGQGGEGGKGGAGGSVLGSGNSSNANTNLQGQGQLQGQQQGQGQAQQANNSQSQSARSNQSQSNRSSNRIEGGNGSGNVVGVSVGGDTVTYEAQKRDPVATAYAAPLAASNGTCMGSSSGGAQGTGFGLTIGTTWTDSGCDARYDATALVQAGMQKAAIERLCLKAEIRQAMQAAGTPCDADRKAASTPTKRAAAEEPAQQVTYADPIIRARLGLPPLK